MRKYTLNNLSCANCAAKIEDAILSTPGVKFASVDFPTNTLFLDAIDFESVQKTVLKVEPQVEILTREEEELGEEEFEFRKKMIPLLVSAILFFGGLIFIDELRSTPYGMGEWIIFGIAYLISGRDVLRKAGRNLSQGQIFDENFLMSVATIGAILIGEMPEAVGVMLFYLVGELAQDYSVSRSRRSIRRLLNVRPDKANLIVDGKTIEVHPTKVLVGNLILVRPGEKVPLDGTIIKGTSRMDMSILTGESYPRFVEKGDSVFAGSINQSGLLTLQVTQPFSQSSVNRILELVQNARSRKAKSEKFITKFARIYSPIVVGIAVVVALLGPLITGTPFNEWIYRALVVLVISCPCALVISIPLGYFGGVGGASRRGILVKGSNFLDTLAEVSTVVFDKTGTLTEGVFEVTQIEPKNGFDEKDLLYFAVQAESNSDHPIAQSIRDAFGDVPAVSIDSFEEIAGHGVVATFEGREILLGNDSLLHSSSVHHKTEFCDLAGTVVHLAVDKKYAGYLVIADKLKGDASQAVKDLQANGIDNIVMLTGDAESTAQMTADALEIHNYRSRMLPEEKVVVIESVMGNRINNGKLAFVGDGINDTPALARADVGIAMGALGSEAAIETADVVIMSDSPLKISEAISVGRRTRLIVWQNIAFALVVKTIFILLGVAGIANMWMAVIGDMGVALIAVANSMRVLHGSSVD